MLFTLKRKSEHFISQKSPAAPRPARYARDSASGATQPLNLCLHPPLGHHDHGWSRQTQIRSRLLIIWIENWTTPWDSVGQVGCDDLAVCGLGYGRRRPSTVACLRLVQKLDARDVLVVLDMLNVSVRIHVSLYSSGSVL